MSAPEKVKDMSWRDRPMTDMQRARLTLLLLDAPPAGLTSGEASDLFYVTQAGRGLRCRT